MHEQLQAIGTGMMDVVQMWDEATSFLVRADEKFTSQRTGNTSRNNHVACMIINANHGIIVYGVWVLSSVEFRHSV